MPNDDIIEEILQATDLRSVDDPRLEQLRFYINYLILSDFNSLLTLLYRLDIDEAQLRKVLKTQVSTDAADIIAQMIITRQIQKSEARKDRNDAGRSEEERW